MNIGKYALRAIYALIACVILVYLFSAAVSAFLPNVFTPTQIHFIDVLIFIVGFCYVIFGENWFNTPA